MALIPEEEWTEYSHRIITHGRQICVARKPKCEICPLQELCPYFQKLLAAERKKRADQAMGTTGSVDETSFVRSRNNCSRLSSVPMRCFSSASVPKKITLPRLKMAMRSASSSATLSTWVHRNTVGRPRPARETVASQCARFADRGLP